MSNSSIGGGGLSSPVGETDGGTGQTSYTTGDILYSSATDTLSKLNIGSIPGGKLMIGFDGIPIWFDPLKYFYVCDDILLGAIGGQWDINQSAGIVIRNANITGSSTNPGNIYSYTSTAGASMNISAGFSNTWGALLPGGGRIYSHWIFSLSDALSDGTDTTIIRLGWSDQQSAAANNGIYFSYTDTGASPNWKINCANGGSTTTQDSGIAADLNYHVFAFQVNAAGSSVTFYIDGSAVSTPITTNIPAAGSFPQVYFGKTAGTNQQSIYIDQFYLFGELTTSR